MQSDNRDPFWAWLDTKPEQEDIGTAEENEFFGTVGMMLVTAGAAYMIIAVISPLFIPKTLNWWDWLCAGLQLVGVAFSVWGWIKQGESNDENRNMFTVFRSWRINMLAALINTPLAFLIAGFYVLYTLVWGGGYAGNETKIWLPTTAFMVILTGLFLTLSLKNLWYNYD